MYFRIRQVKNPAARRQQKIETSPASRFLPSRQVVTAMLFIFLFTCLLIPQVNARQPLFEEDLPLVAIDPGHGGNDAGARGPNDTLEKTVTLDLARMLAQRLKERYRVVLTRNGDYQLENAERTAVANHDRAEIFISLHTGGSFIHNINHSAVYFYQPFQESALTTEAHASDAMQDNKPDSAWGKIQLKYRITSEKLAKKIQTGLTAILPPQNITVEGAPLMVLEGADMPAIAIEIGNLSNASSENALDDAQFLSRTAGAIAAGIDAFFAEKPK